MTFQEAFDKAFEAEKERQEKDNVKFAVTPSTARILAFMWNIFAAAEGQFDDMAAIDKNNNIVSIPLETSEEKTEKRGRKKKDTEPSDNINKAGDNVTGNENS